MADNNHSEKEALAVSLKRRFFSIPTLISFGVAAALILFLATRFDLDWSATWDNVRMMDPWLYLLAVVLYYLSFAFRGLRWRMLGKNAAAQESHVADLPTVTTCARLIVIGWFVNSITWLRLGDAYRAYAFAEESRGKFSWSLGTVLAERVIDMATVFVLLLAGAIFLSTSTNQIASRYVVIAGFLMAFALVVVILLMKTYGARLARLLPGRLEAAYHLFHQGTLGSFKQLPALVALGIVGWLLEMARLYFVVQALGLEISIPLVMVVALGHAMLSTVPTPGGLGAVEPGMTGLLALSMARHDAVSITLVDRTITYVSVILIGGLFFLLRQIAHARKARRELAESARASERQTVPDA